jgi:Subtilase family
MRRLCVSLCLALTATLPAPAQEGPVKEPRKPSASRLSNAEVVRRQLGLLPAYTNLAGLRSIKVAVLDHGFDGVADRPYLPADTVVVEHYDADFVRRFNLGDPAFQKTFLSGNSHGRSMAQLVWAMTGNSPQGPHFYLLNSNGPTLFRRAVRYAIEQKVDVLLFAGNFEGGGNYDGHGSINKFVDEAVAAGIIFINASGNSGGSVYNGPVQPDHNGYVRLGKDSLSTALRFRNLLDENDVTITLTWNDYTDEEDAGTDKDLDLYVEDDKGKVIGSSELKQVKGKKQTAPGETLNPRERVVLSDLAAAPGREYRIRVKARSSNFTSKDRLRILITAVRDVPFRDPQTGKITRPVQLLEASESGELFPPADHAGVITVADPTRFSSIGPTADGRIKPDVVLADSTAQFSNGEETTGSSNAAAYFAGVVCVLKAAQPGLQTRHVFALVRSRERSGARSAADPSEPARFPLMPPELPPLTPASVENSMRTSRVPTYQAPASPEPRTSGAQAPAPTSRPGGTSPRPAAQPILSRMPPPHPPWRTPSPEKLAEVVRSLP